MPGRLRQVAIAVAILASLVAAAAPAQQSPAADSLFAAGPRFAAGWLGRIGAGSRYRDLWTTPIEAPTRTLGELSGGLAPTGADSGLHAGELQLRGPDGRQLTFRRLDRDPSSGFPARVRTQLLAGTLSDLVSARHPAAASIVEVLASAAGITVPASRLVRLADDSALGPWRDTFAGRLGYLSDATPAATGDTVTTTELLRLLDAPNATPADTAAYLRERLFDVFLGHWTLTTPEWRWGLRHDEDRWAPLPRHRDAAFANYDGLVIGAASGSVPGFVPFRGRYEKQLGLMPYQRAVDRRLLVGVTRERWDSAARVMRAGLTDSVIAAAVAAMPPEYTAVSGGRLAAQLRLRRDSLPGAALRFYRLLSAEVEIYATNGPDRVAAERSEGVTTLRMGAGFSRKVPLKETAELRLFLLGGEDTLDVSGPSKRTPRLLVTASPEAAVRGDSNGLEGVQILPAARTALPDALETDTIPPPSTSGSAYTPLGWFRLDSDVGFLFGAGIQRTGYGLGFGEYRSRQQVRAAYATTPDEVAIEYKGEFRRRYTQNYFGLEARRSGIDVLRYFGFGNETERTQDLDFYRVRHRSIAVIPSINFPLGGRSTVSFSAMVKHVRTDTTADQLIVREAPYGVPDFGQIGFMASITRETRDRVAFTRGGSLLSFSTAWYPGVWDAEEPFGSVSASAAGYLTPAGFSRLTLAGRLWGQIAFGTYPYYEAVFLGGARSLRGYEPQRFAGDAGVLLNSEARLHLARLHAAMPLDVGVVGIADVGRVWLEGESSDVWHAGTGGGLWFALPDRSFGLVVSYVQSVDDNSVLFETGFGF
jgi:hypothetical protein